MNSLQKFISEAKESNTISAIDSVKHALAEKAREVVARVNAEVAQEFGLSEKKDEEYEEKDDDDKEDERDDKDSDEDAEDEE
jgi:hypothetical protein